MSRPVYEREQAMQGRVLAVYTETAQMYRTHTAHLKALTDHVYSCDVYKKLPQYARHAVRATAFAYDRMFHARGFMVANDVPLIWILIGPDGRMFDGYADEWLEESQEYKSALRGDHCWREAWNKGQFKPFAIERETAHSDPLDK